MFNQRCPRGTYAATSVCSTRALTLEACEQRTPLARRRTVEDEHYIHVIFPERGERFRIFKRSSLIKLSKHLIQASGGMAKCPALILTANPIKIVRSKGLPTYPCRASDSASTGASGAVHPREVLPDYDPGRGGELQSLQGPTPPVISPAHYSCSQSKYCDDLYNQMITWSTSICKAYLENGFATTGGEQCLTVPFCTAPCRAVPCSLHPRNRIRRNCS